MTRHNDNVELYIEWQRLCSKVRPSDDLTLHNLAISCGADDAYNAVSRDIQGGSKKVSC